MNIAISVREIITIPDDKLNKVIGRVVKQFDLDKWSPISNEDLLIQAEALGIIERLPDHWTIEEEEEFEQSELRARAKASK